MNLGTLNETVILIDTDFLNERIKWNWDFYTDLYPDRNFQKIDLADLLYKFALNSKVDEEGHNVDIIFAYTLSNSNLLHCVPGNLSSKKFIDGVQIETDKGTFFIRSFFADEDETCSEHFVNIVRMINYNQRVSRISMVADSPELNFQLEMMYEQNNKSLFLLKKYYDSEIDVPIRYVNIDSLIAYALGLNSNEI